jgi:hypothetical protein
VNPSATGRCAFNEEALVDDTEDVDRSAQAILRCAAAAAEALRSATPA